MSDLTREAAGTAGSSSRAYAGERTASAQAVPQDTSRIRTPRQILNARQARQRTEEETSRREAEEAAQVDEERRLAEQDTQRKIDLERRKSAERRAAATTQQRDSGYKTGTSTAGGRTPGNIIYGTPTAAGPNDPAQSSQYMRTQYGDDVPADPPITSLRAAQPTGRARGTGTTQQAAPQPQQYPTSASTHAQQQQQLPQTRTGQGQAYPPNTSQSTAQQQLPSRSGASSFPHAFERWEQLSAQWEGITSSFIRKLETYVTNNGPLPPDQAVMGRQISDLSAAGANLFHAVVELQRLRASSERKFQRWFFETRSQHEVYAEEIARLEREHENVRTDLDNVRGERDSAHSDLDNLRSRGFDPSSDMRMQEMRRELQISKDEAKRAWEELGRREEMELAQQQDLRSGRAAFVGGVQVLPSSVISRGASLRQPGVRDIYTTQPGAGGQQYDYQEPSPTDTDPFTESRQRHQPLYTSIVQPPMQSPMYQQQQQQQQQQSQRSQQAQIPTNRGGAASPGFYSQPNTFLHEQSLGVPPSRSPGSASSEDPGPEIDEYGNVRRDPQGRPIPFRSPAPMTGAIQLPPSIPTSSGAGFTGGGSGGSSIPPPAIPPSALRQQRQEDDVPEVISSPESSEPDDDEEYQARQVRRTQAQTQSGISGGTQSAMGRILPGPATAADYEGEGFGSGQGWEEMEASRHHHPTRLSDVMEEEDERSRTSGGSRGFG